MHKRLLLSIIAAFAALWGVTVEAKTIKVGFSMSKTGIFAAAAGSQLNTYKMWSEQVNARGGLKFDGKKHPVKLVFYDDQSNTGKAVQIYEKLITNDKVDLLLAPWGTALHVAIVGVLERYKFPMVGNTAASVLLREVKAGNIWFPTSSFPDTQSVAVAEILKNQGVKSVSLITNQLQYTQENKKFIIPELKKAGIKLLVNEDYPPNVKDMTALLTKVKSANADAVLAYTYPGDSVLYAKGAREVGLNAKTQVVLLGPQYGFFLGIFGAAANGLITMGHWTPFRKDWPKAKKYWDDYTARWKGPPDTLDAPMTQMSLEILEQAVAQSGLDRDKLRKTISSETFQTVNGPVRFEGVMNVLLPAMMSQIQGGNTHIIWPPKQATAKIIPKPAWK